MKAKRPSLRERWEQLGAQNPFIRLVQHFAQKTVGASDTASDVDLGIGGALGLLAAPGAFTAIGLLEKYSTLFHWMMGEPHFDAYRLSISDEYFFLMYAMAITGLVTVLRWNHLLPGRIDFANLAPLPLPLRSIFLANVVALTGTALLFAIDINAFSSLFFPFLVTMQEGTLPAVLRFGFAHVSAVMGITVFTFAALLALQGMLMALLPDTLYRRVSLVLRTALLILFFALLISAFAFPLSALNFKLGSKLAGTWWPPLWFVSLFENLLPQLRQSAPMPGTVAVGSVAAAVSLAIIGFTLSYRRYFLRIAERAEGPARPSRIRVLDFHWLQPVLRLWLTPGPETAAHTFVLKTLLRSETHLLFLGLWAGIGFLLALEGLTGVHSADHAKGEQIGAILAAPLIFGYSVLAGLRFVFDLPATISANWVFRLAATEGELAPEAVCRKVMALFVLPWLFAIWLPATAAHIGWTSATLALSVTVLTLMVGIEGLLLGYSKIPFTCSFTADRDSMLRLLVVSLVTLVFVIPSVVRWEGAIIHRPWKLIVYGAVAMTVIVWLRSRAHAARASTVFEDRRVETFALLRLSGE